MWALLAVFNGKGKAWARIVLCVVAGLSILFGLFGLLGAADPLTLVLTIVRLVVLIGVVVLVFKPESSSYYKARS